MTKSMAVPFQTCTLTLQLDLLAPLRDRTRDALRCRSMGQALRLLSHLPTVRLRHDWSETRQVPCLPDLCQLLHFNKQGRPSPH